MIDRAHAQRLAHRAMPREQETATMAALIRLQDVQRKIEALRAERDHWIVALDGRVGTRELARFIGLSAAQVSRIRTARR